MIRPEEHDRLTQLCKSKSTRNAVFEHVLIGLMNSKIRGKHVHIKLDKLIAEYTAINDVVRQLRWTEEKLNEAQTRIQTLTAENEQLRKDKG